MKKQAIIFIGLFVSMSLRAQVTFRTIVPQNAIVTGESFQVQFTLEDGEEVSNLKPPAFPSFRLVSGPNTYHGYVATIHGVKPLKNIVYTLAATRPGHFIIPGATAINEGNLIRSNEAEVEVISKEEAIKRMRGDDVLTGSDYMLRPGEDPHEKIRQNLFLKLMVDKRSCYVGEPVLATFKLYSRLESRSDIVKNPGLYGFTVHDMINLSDKQVSRERVNGRTFDVHTIRKVQLYPLQGGQFSVDAMEIKNRVEFTRSVINKRSEQEFVEGIPGYENEDLHGEGTEVYETNMHTVPVMIEVKPIPVRSRPPAYNGAVGKYTISAALIGKVPSRDEQGIFEITISGKGNFIQLDAPKVNWPAGIEGFDATIRDQLDRTTVPLAGHRVFRYPFVATKPGSYNIPAIHFSYFDPDSGIFKTVSTTPVQLSIKASAIRGKLKNKVVLPGGTAVRQWIIWAIGISLLLLISSLFYIKSKKTVTKPVPGKVRESIDTILSPVYEHLDVGDKLFYHTLNQATWEYLKSVFNISGSDMNKEYLFSQLRTRNIDTDVINELLNIQRLCESGMFTNADLLTDKKALLVQTEKLLNRLENSLF